VPQLAPSEYTRDHRRWGVVLGAIARSGFVVASPNLADIIRYSDACADRIDATIQWMRHTWPGRETITTELEIGLPFVSPRLAGTETAGDVKVGQEVIEASAFPPRQPWPERVPRNPTPLALVGHSWGTRAVCRYAATRQGVSGLVTIAGTFDDNQAGQDIVNAGVPTLMLCGRDDSQNFAPMNSLFGSMPTPKYQTAFQGVGHWDWFGRFGAIRRADGTLTQWRDTGHIAGELVAGFLVRHVARVGFSPSLFINIPLLRPNHIPWYDHGSAIQMRWDAPGENFGSVLPSTGDGILGPWATSPPW
jgi:hypothetical protein